MTLLVGSCSGFVECPNPNLNAPPVRKDDCQEVGLGIGCTFVLDGDHGGVCAIGEGTFEGPHKSNEVLIRGIDVRRKLSRKMRNFSCREKDGTNKWLRRLAL